MIRTRALLLLVILGALTGCAAGAGAPSATIVAAARVTDSESAARLTSEGKILYEADATKKTGYQYCSLAYGLAEQGEFRRAIREASKALYLGETGRGDTCLGAMAKRDLASAYSFAGQLDRARQFAADAADGASACGRPGTVSVPARKILGDVSLRRGRAQEAISHYERALAESPANFQPLVRSSHSHVCIVIKLRMNNGGTHSRARG